MEDSSSGQFPEAFSEVGRKTGIQLKQLRTFCDSREPSASPKVGDGSKRMRGSVMAPAGFHLEAGEASGGSRRARGSIMAPGFHLDGDGSKGSSAGRMGKRATVSGFSRADLESGREGLATARAAHTAAANWRKVRNLVSAAGTWQQATGGAGSSIGRRSSGGSQSQSQSASPASKQYPPNMTLTDSSGHHTGNSMASAGRPPPLAFATTTPHGSVNVMNLTGGRPSLASPASGVGGGAGSVAGTARSSLVGLRMDAQGSNVDKSSIGGSPNHGARGSVAATRMVGSTSNRHRATVVPSATLREEEEESSKPRMSRKMRIALGEDVPPARPPPPELASTCFSSGGMERRRYCERAVAHHARWVFPAKSEEHPDGLHYKPNLKQVVSRLPEWEFGERAKHPSRKVVVGDINTEDPYSHINLQSPLFCASLRAASAPANGVQPLLVATARKPLNKSVGRSAAFFFHTPILEPTEWSQQDKASSLRHDLAVADFKHYGGRTSKKPHSYFDPGRCTAKPSSPQNSVDMSKTVGRAAAQAGQVGHSVPPGSLQSEGVGVVPDRSLYRGCNTKSITHVSDFGNDSERPPLMKPPEVYYDESNPEVCDAWLAHRLTYDPSTADRAIMRRQDQSPNIGRCIAREQSRGGRLLETDKSFIAAIGKGDKVPAANLDLDKEDPSRARRDLGVARFEHYSSREPQRQQGECSALRRPRSMAAPDFARTARKGFLAKTSLRRLAPPPSAIAAAGNPSDAASVLTANGNGGLGSTLDRAQTSSRLPSAKSARGTSARSRTKDSEEEVVPYWCSELVDEQEARAPPYFPTEWPDASAEAAEAVEAVEAVEAA